MRNGLATTFVAAAFFLSGGCGLVYESLWTRYLSELTGATALSQLIVLMVFMGGLALGAVLIGRVVDRDGGRGLFFYGALEVCIGIYAIVFPDLHRMLSGLYYGAGASLGSGTTGLFALKVLLSFVLIITPAIAMGGTLPAVTRYLTRSFDTLRVNISLLYGINSLGAVFGILAGGFFLVYMFGVDVSMRYTGLFNVLIGVAALAFALYEQPAMAMGDDVAANEPACPPEAADRHVYSPAEIRMAVVVAGLSGFAAMALQVVWIRYFAIILGATHSSFTIVVAAFVFGIGLGALLARTQAFGRTSLPTVLLGLMFLISVILGLYMFLYARLPYEIGRILGIFAHTPLAWPFYSFTKFGILFALMSAQTLASGMVLPLCVRIAERSAASIGRDVARIYAVNTVCSLVGIVVAGEVLFRLFDLPHTLLAITLLYPATAIFLVFMRGGRARMGVVLTVSILLALFFAFWRPWSPDLLFVSRIHFGQNERYAYKNFVRYNKQNRHIIKDVHGPDMHATVVENSASENTYRSLFINGKPDASSNRDLPIQVMLGHLPVLLHAAPENVFVLGLGSGITTASVLQFQEIQEVVTAELATEIVEASKAFADYNGRFWENPRHRLVVDDGMTYLRLAEEKFDVITLQPSNIWQAGMPGLFSEDFFRLVKSRLKPGGLVAQWLHTYSINDLSVDIVIKTFSSVFPKASIFMVNEDNFMLVGYEEEWHFDAKSMTRRFHEPRVFELEKRIGNVNPLSMLLREVMDRKSVHAYSRVLEEPVNTLNWPVLEKAAEYGLFMQYSSSLIVNNESRGDSDGGDLLVHEYEEQEGFDAEQNLAVIESGMLDDATRLRESLALQLLDKAWSGQLPVPPASVLPFIQDPQLREIVTHPLYRQSPELLSVRDAHNILGAELVIWNKAATQLWKPDPERLYHLYNRLAEEVDEETAGTVARRAGISLSLSTACSPALSFFRFAEEKGQMDPATLTNGEIAVLFSCEVKAGDATRADQWWRDIEERGLIVTPEMRRDRATLDITLGR